MPELRRKPESLSDSSRAKNRHWCGMDTCGNKAKVRAFRERQRAMTTE